MRKKVDIDEKTWRLGRKIARNIRRLRADKGLTQEDMEEMGFGRRWYQRFETGKYIPTIPTLDRLARSLKVEITEFFK